MKKISLSLILLTLLAILSFFATKISFDNSKWLPKNDPQEILKNYIVENFNQKDDVGCGHSTGAKIFHKARH